jgi:hypothetical protein
VSGQSKGSIVVADKLNLLDSFPSLTLNVAGGGSVTLPDDISTPYAIVLFYRGHW